MPAIQAYEAQVLDYGFAAVRRSLRNARKTGSANRLSRIIFRGGLRTKSALLPVRSKLAATVGS
jgi:hypothetical protein